MKLRLLLLIPLLLMCSCSKKEDSIKEEKAQELYNSFLNEKYYYVQETLSRTNKNEKTGEETQVPIDVYSLDVTKVDFVSIDQEYTEYNLEDNKVISKRAINKRFSSSNYYYSTKESNRSENYNRVIEAYIFEKDAQSQSYWKDSGSPFPVCSRIENNFNWNQPINSSAFPYVYFMFTCNLYKYGESSRNSLLWAQLIGLNANLHERIDEFIPFIDVDYISKAQDSLEIEFEYHNSGLNNNFGCELASNYLNINDLVYKLHFENKLIISSYLSVNAKHPTNPNTRQAIPAFKREQTISYSYDEFNISHPNVDELTNSN